MHFRYKHTWLDYPALVTYAVHVRIPREGHRYVLRNEHERGARIEREKIETGIGGGTSSDRPTFQNVHVPSEIPDLPLEDHQDRYSLSLSLSLSKRGHAHTNQRNSVRSPSNSTSMHAARVHLCTRGPFVRARVPRYTYRNARGREEASAFVAATALRSRIYLAGEVKRVSSLVSIYQTGLSGIQTDVYTYSTPSPLASTYTGPLSVKANG